MIVKLKATIYSHKQLIGTADLQIGDESMGCVFGEFKPNENYFHFIQKSVWKFYLKREPDYKQWDSLNFNIQLENGFFLGPKNILTIDDIPDLPEEPKQIDIAGIDRFIIEDFFLQDIPRPFLEDPWEKITIEQKIIFEEELNKEIGLVDKSFFDMFRITKKEKHILADLKVSAIGKYGSSDDILFAIDKQDEKQFAVIHLTWKGKPEVENFPLTVFYKNFDEFKYLRMYADKAEWED